MIKYNESYIPIERGKIMKKLLMFLCCIFAMSTIVAYGATEKTCSETKLYLESGQNIDDDEFLYRNDSEHEKAKNGVLNSTARSGGDAMVYECDRSNRDKNCGNRGVVTLEPGHWYMGNRIDHKETYTCWTNNVLHWNDKWVPGASVCRIQNTEVAIGSSYEKSLTLEQCSGLNISDPVNGTSFKAICEEGPVARCIAIECVSGFEPDEKGICKPKENEHVSDKPDPTPPVKPTKPTAPVKPTKPTTPVKPDPKPIEPVVVVEPAPVVVYNCPDEVLNVPASCTEAVAAYAELKKYCESEARDDSGYYVRKVDVQNKIAACEQKKQEEVANKLRGSIKQLEAKITNGIGDWQSKLSVWKTSEGNFNGARLASDSIAGVVLGTAGGLITSNLVKKGQVKSGFEGVQCTIGGQRVADWHDEFTVGIR